MTDFIIGPNTSGAFAGGIAGSGGATSHISNSYNVGNISVNSRSEYCYAGGLFGGVRRDDGEIVISDSYWNIDSIQEVRGSQRAVGDKVGIGRGAEVASSLTSAQMRQQSSFVGWDFDTVWVIDPAVNDGFPYLRGLPIIDPSVYNASGLKGQLIFLAVAVGGDAIVALKRKKHNYRKKKVEIRYGYKGCNPLYRMRSEVRRRRLVMLNLREKCCRIGKRRCE